MTRIVIVGEMYYSELSIGGGPMPGGQPGRPDQGLPGGSGGQPSHPIYHPGHPDHGLPAFPSQGLPGGSGGQPSHPIYHPGHPDHGLPAFPSQGLPGGGGQPPRPDNTLPPGGETVPPETLPPPAGYEDQIVVAVYQPEKGWTAKSYDPSLSAGTPPVTPQPTPH